MKQNGLFLIAIVCFFLSGFAGLIYEVVWMRMLTQIFGNTTYAIATALGKLALARGEFHNGVSLLEEADRRGENSANLYGALGVQPLEAMGESGFCL